MRAHRSHAAAVALLSAFALALPGASALAGGPPAAGAPAASAATAGKVKGGRLVLLTKHTIVPKVQRTVHFTGYATYTFAAPRGRRIVSASTRIVGAEAHAVTIRGHTVSRDHRRYTVRLVFPGEQGNPGRLVVTLGSVA